MGGAVSDLVKAEKLSWMKAHSLEVDANLRRAQLPLLKNFTARLHLCSQSRKMRGFQYYHYFVTDGTWTIEFGGGETLACTILVHSNPKGAYDIEKSFGKTDDMVQRMGEVCGARGYSLCLRNCEHVARYIISGSWVCMQMLPASPMSKSFLKAMVVDQRAKINVPPTELEPRQMIVEVYPGQQAFLTYQGSPGALLKDDERAYNVLVLGPTGCGKSRIINLLFNQTVCASEASATSVTKHVQITSGTGTIHCSRRKVNIIDTIGFCDTTLSPSSVLALIKDKVKSNMMFIDRVLIICSGRIEKEHLESITKVMGWLKYREYPFNFTFVYSKADQLSSAQKETNLATMCSLLETGYHELAMEKEVLPSTWLQGDASNEHANYIKRLKLACGFPPSASYAEITDDFHELLDNTFIYHANTYRIPAEESWCSIL